MKNKRFLYTNEQLVQAAASNPAFLQFKNPRDPRVLEAMRRVDRRDFLDDTMFPVRDPSDESLAAIQLAEDKLSGKSILAPGENDAKLIRIAAYAAFALIGSLRTFNVSPRALAYNDQTFPIGHNQSCSKPSLIAFMDDVLEIERGYNVLEVGTGSGYHAAVTYELIGPDGKLTTVEVIPELAEFGRMNLDKHTKTSGKVEVITGSGKTGYDRNAPYHRIYLTAGVNDDFSEEVFLEQLDRKNGALLYPDPTGFNLAVYRDGRLEKKRFEIGLSFVPLRP
ncbi:MAG: hypothetical protein HY513_02330 [Candidatus Aenigmarchaeota archaeon]|nr:hypothetical protein [Candidatus Aenigmarchaeota archaeon]